MYDVDIADDLVDEGLDVGVPDADRMVVGRCEEQDQALMKSHARDRTCVLFVLELFGLRYGIPEY